MKKIFLSFLIITSVVMLSACGSNTNKQENNADLNTSEEHKVINRNSINEAPNDVLLAGTNPKKQDKAKIFSTKEENGIITRTGEKIGEDGKIIKYSETGKKQNDDTIVVKRIYDDGRKVMIVAKQANGKRYAKLYVVYPDGTKDSAEIVTTFNSDGTSKTEYIKNPQKGYFL